jgi:Zn finger protein HypA/HybF involved in hydrogenase expression
MTSICWKCGEKYQTTSVSTVLCPKCIPKVTVYFSDSTNMKLAGLEEPNHKCGAHVKVLEG